MNSEAERYRMKAAECARAADLASDPAEQARLRDDVEAWLLLAEMLTPPTARPAENSSPRRSKANFP